MKKFFIIILSIVLFCDTIFAESQTTSLTDPKQIATFQEVTTKIRCICLPSLPIKSCSFNNCEISAKLKQFLENRIKEGENAETIIQKIQTGFGEKAIEDPIVKALLESGNRNFVAGIVNGFGESILAEPNSIWINLTLTLFAILGLGIIYYFFILKRKVQSLSTKSENQNLEKYLKEL
ncbi:MAG: cytochrome c-type biogenesis protein CcmH [Leptospiraceae bacterium]|nr:cytochrome c-type biogenesis protein CcmH [Leptospiraceae bacterium]